MVYGRLANNTNLPNDINNHRHRLYHGFRVHHGYRNTHGDWVMSSVGMGTVLNFDTLRHTVTHTCGIAGTHRYFIMG